MIDLHCHILPAVDDGAASLAESVAMARQAEADGIEIVCATPHIRHDHDVRIDELSEATEGLNRALGSAGTSTRVIAAGEVAAPILGHLDNDELAVVALGGRWILLEPFAGPLDDRLLESVVALTERGFRALVAHPERHPGEELHDVLLRAVNAGALVQATAAHVAAGAASQTLVNLARGGLVHVLGSDSHSSRVGRPVRLSDGLAKFADDAELRPHIEWIAETAPGAIVRGEDIEPPIRPA